MLARCRPRISFHSRLFSTASSRSLRDAARNQLDGAPETPWIDTSTLSHQTLAELANLPPHSFLIYPHLLTLDEQRTLLDSALTKLGGKRRRKPREAPIQTGPTGAYPLQESFGQDAEYTFEEGHFDGVIHDFREITVSSWPLSSSPHLPELLSRLHALVDPRSAQPGTGLITPPAIQTHVLHLASTGFILPHVDNVEASGSLIVGISLGDTRVLRMTRNRDGQPEKFDVLLESGSAYVQRDNIRYGWKHEIPNTATFRGQPVGNRGQRLSVMLRASFIPFVSSDKYAHMS